MSKIICDLCGTTFPETATQCPICGSARPVNCDNLVADAPSENLQRTYTPVKGGRFSKANVKKRNRAMQASVGAATTRTSANARKAPAKKKSNLGLVITAIVLLLAIIAVVIFLAVKLFGDPLPPKEDVKPSAGVEQPQIDPNPTEKRVPCTGLSVVAEEFELTEIGSIRLLAVTPEPENCTDDVTYSSSDPTVVTVNEKGKVECVGSGTAVITIRCGSEEITCTVHCNIEQVPEETTEATEETTLPAFDLKLNRKDFTLSYKGEKWMLFDGGMDAAQITWTSGDPNVATIENGMVVAVGEGDTVVSAEYNGVKVECIVRCYFQSSSDQGVPGHGGVGEDT